MSLIISARTISAETQLPLPLAQMPESRTALVDGRSIHYYDWGRSDAVTVLIGVHGWAGGGIDFFALARVLTAAHPNIRLIALDMPGAGFSERPKESLGMDGNVRFLAAWFDYVRRELTGKSQARLIPLAHSMGGHILLRTLWAYRFNPAISDASEPLRQLIATFDRIILLAPDGLRGEEGLLLALRNKALIRQFGPWMSADMHRQNSRTSVYYDMDLCPTIIEDLAYAALQYNQGFAALADTTKDTLGSQPLDGQLSSFQLPTLLMWGKQDKILPFRYAKVFAGELPQVRFQALDHCGHAVQTDQADAVAALIADFINS